MKPTARTVEIHGRDYETVASRVARFREDHPGLSIETTIIDRTETDVVVRAVISEVNGFILATGHAEEQRNGSQINRTSALENCETSAIGRALACLGYSGGEFASANEVQNAVHQQQTPQVDKAALVKALTDEWKTRNPQHDVEDDTVYKQRCINWMKANGGPANLAPPNWTLEQINKCMAILTAAPAMATADSLPSPKGVTQLTVNKLKKIFIDKYPGDSWVDEVRMSLDLAHFDPDDLAQWTPEYVETMAKILAL